jgi:hypothetical protein
MDQIRERPEIDQGLFIAWVQHPGAIRRGGCLLQQQQRL